MFLERSSPLEMWRSTKAVLQLQARTSFAFVREDAPWVIHLQEIQLRNMALVASPMRGYEPFFLTSNELGQHGAWLWGGAMHVYTANHRELTVEALTEWFALLLPS